MKKVESTTPCVYLCPRATGGPAIGHRKLRALAERPSLMQAWIAGLRLADSTELGVIGYVCSVLDAAVDDGLITRKPVHARSITRPASDKHEAIPLTLSQVETLTEAAASHQRPLGKLRQMRRKPTSGIASSMCSGR